MAHNNDATHNVEEKHITKKHTSVIIIAPPWASELDFTINFHGRRSPQQNCEAIRTTKQPATLTDDTVALDPRRATKENYEKLVLRRITEPDYPSLSLLPWGPHRHKQTSSLHGPLQRSSDFKPQTNHGKPVNTLQRLLQSCGDSIFVHPHSRCYRSRRRPPTQITDPLAGPSNKILKRKEWHEAEDAAMPPPAR
jgi:hypothetical protein